MADLNQIVLQLRERLIAYFCENPTKIIKTVNICRSVDQPKKIVNSILYKLQREGILKKVVESPPAWQYVINNIELLQELNSSMPTENSKNNLAEHILLALQEANGCLTPKEISERLGSTETAIRLVMFSLEMKGQIVKLDANLYTAAPQDSKDDIITNDKIIPQACDNKVQDTADAIVMYIKQCQGPTSSTNIAKALGYRTKKEINPVLYHLQAKLILKKVKDVPPLWYLADGINHVEDPVDSEPLAPNPTDVEQQPETLPSQNTQVFKSRTIAPPTKPNQKESKASKPSITSTNTTLTQLPLPTNDIIQHPPLIDTGLNGLNIYTHNGTMKNPISVFNEYGQRNHIDTKIEVIYSEGPSHNPRFTAAAFLGEEKIAEASEKTKKEAKRLAAEIAVTMLSGRFNANASEQVISGEDEIIESEIHIKPYIRETSSESKERTKQDIILQLLQEHDTLTSKEINARSSLSESAVKLVLNQLLFQGLVKKVDGRPPLWTLIKSPEEIKSLENQTLDIITNIIKFLRSAKEDATTQKILDALGFSGKKQLTPLLHRLQTKNIIVKIPNTPPLWRLKDAYLEQDPNLEEVIKANAPDNIPFENRIIQAMAKHSKAALSTNEVAEALGLKNQLEIGSILTELNRKGAIKKVYDVPPTWSLPDRLDEERQPSPTPLSTKEVAKLFALSCRVSGPQTLYLNEVPDPQQMNNTPNPEEEEKPLPQSVIDVLNSESFAALMKNPVSAFHEYGQRNRVEAKVEIVSHQGPSHDPRFKAVATLGDEPLGEAWDKTKKDAKRQAAELAVRNLVAKGKMPKLENPLPVLEFSSDNGGGNGGGGTLRRFDIVAALSHKAFNEKVLEVPEYMGGRKVLAALVMFRGETDTDGSVISLGTGNRCITGLHLSQDGLVVNDSHAEVITRRGFMRFLYNQLRSYHPGKEHPILEPSATGDKLKVKDGITFHLYISTAPCGDGALFAHNPKPGEPMEAPESNDGKHHPIYSKSLQGLLRAKMEAGEGTIPIDNAHHGLQNWDGILMGERLRTMSCSDKIARWNVVGLQGALLNLFIEPVYLCSVTLGNLYHHGHLSRAVCCRLDGNKGEPTLSDLLPSPFRHIHPILGKMALYAPPRETEKTKPHSINWCLGDEKPELISGVTGTVNGGGAGNESRLCKAAMFLNFKETCRVLGRGEFMDRNYRNSKMLATDYQKAKAILFDRFKKLGRGTWIRKPIEEEEFI